MKKARLKLIHSFLILLIALAALCIGMTLWNPSGGFGNQATIQITFDYQYNDQKTIQYVSPGLLKAPSQPARYGYTIDAWYLEDNGNTVLWDFEKMSVGSEDDELTFIAHWAPIECVLQMDANGGTCSAEQITVAFDSPYSLPTPTRDGYYFLGWFYERGKELTSGTWDIVRIDSKPIQLTAQWSGTASYGKTVQFGSFQQRSGNEAPDDIEWVIIDRDSNRNYLLISKKILYYLVEPAKKNWETSLTRQWLNETFYNTAFSDAEKVLICPKQVSGTSCTDWIYLLSREEVLSYLPVDGTFNALNSAAVEADTWGNRSSRGGSGPNGEPYTCNLWAVRESIYFSETSFYGNFSGGTIGTIYLRPAMWVSEDALPSHLRT